MQNVINLFSEKGTPLEKQKFTWKEIVGKPISKLDDNAFTRLRIILMNGIELDALRIKHITRCNQELRIPLAHLRRIEHHQATTINWMLSTDHSPLETTIAYEQAAIEFTAAVAQTEPDSYQAQTYRFGLLEDFDHLYRYAAMLDRLEGKDANHILQNYTDILPGRSTSEQHRDPSDDIRQSYQKQNAQLITKIHAAMITAIEFQTQQYYLTIGPLFSDPVARQLYAEIASIEEQHHVTQYGSLQDPKETFLEKCLIHEVMEAYNYYSCAEQETNPRIRAIWERFFDYELGQVNFVGELFKKYEKRDPQEIITQPLPKLIQLHSQRDYIHSVLTSEINLRANGKQFVSKDKESKATLDYRQQLNSDGSAADSVSAGYCWYPATELNRETIMEI